MSLLYILLIYEILLFLCAWTTFKKDLLSPTILSYIIFIPATILNIIEIKLWKIEFYFDTLIVLVIGLLSMFIGEYIARKKFAKRKWNINYSPVNIHIPWSLIVVIAVSCVVLTCLYYREMIVFIVLNALDNIGEAKEIMTTDDFNINPVIKQGYKIVVAEAYICGFLLVYNLLNKKEKLKSCLLAIPVICGMGISVCGGNRVEILKIISGILFFYYILDQVMCGWKSRPNIKLIKITMPIVVVFIAMFSFLRTVTKADPTVQDNMGSVVDYTAYYGGSPIQVLNLKIHRGIDNWRTNYFARQTFSGVYDFLAKHHMMELPHARYGSMVYVGGDSNASGNVDTIFGRTYNDFGLFGMAAFIFGLYYYFSRFYYRHIYRHPISKSKDIYRLIMYAFFYSIVIVFAFYDTTVYFIFSQTGVLQILVLLFLMKFQLPKKRVTC